jgi:dynein light intermediate chain 1
LDIEAVLTGLQAEKMEYLEKNHGWKEEDFDNVLQFMRTALLRRES